ncbi:RNase H domain-containing protein [Aphis craccivora]|uniref:RNase H domain-containing protein n=1 Tax=Aphis craccivora TaxID=307492 RepID=A0A6G0Z4I9_APHCR|nr:RNase H domain-containing protein [Aphis craccivora]
MGKYGIDMLHRCLPTCDLCKSPLTIEHITINCPNSQSRQNLLNNLASLEETLNQFFKPIGLDKKIFENNSRLIIVVIEASIRRIYYKYSYCCCKTPKIWYAKQ